MADRELASAARKAHAEVTEAVAELMAIAEKQKAEIKRLRAECGEANKQRDEARREVCRLMSMFNSENSVEIAASRSWDCFKETQ